MCGTDIDIVIIGFELQGLVYMQGQPALLYLIPCTLGTLWVLAWRRGESGLLWKRDVAAEALEHARKSHAPDRPDEESGAAFVSPVGII